MVRHLTGRRPTRKETAGGNTPGETPITSMSGGPLRTPVTTVAGVSTLGSVTFVDAVLSMPVPAGAKALIVCVVSITLA